MGTRGLTAYAACKLEGFLLPRIPAIIKLMAKILIIEDDTFLASVLMQELGKEHEVRRADDGLLALKALKDWTPEMMILDLMMPNMDGFEFLEQVKKNATHASIPVLVLTNLGGKEDLARAKAAGALEAIVKVELTPKQVHQRVNDFIAQHVKKA